MFVSTQGRTKVLSAARALVRRRGYAGVSLRQIAAAAKYSPAGLYAHFPGLAAILENLADCVRSELGQRLEGAAAREPDPLEQMAAVGMAYIAFAVEHPGEFELLFRHTKSRKRSMIDPRPSSFDLLRRIARRIAPDAPPDLIDTACLGLWSTAHGLAVLRITHLSGADFDWEAWSRRIVLSQARALLCGH